ncbi:Crotonobetainyl-CoA:carnitine CoA-transferase CaiB [Pseudooceanicola antarcticus]|uniref:Carnitine dehydratase n=1 Tax=Pseudooceanicola antarcticus TaxID=1247613 RepID=A0A285IPT6_9RHOB|nr:CoA transferase [Pseudooceanicola antarcticus]PJE31444.1 carnitine dehydratase [Pseudooceanicola antarcticus]SNY49964.1 Crotonobetainyl-CoA:carnitine CoA-transferase CaiB [Pseudooceanicola antarcticus]
MKLLEGLKVVVLADRLVDFGGVMLARMGAEVVLAGACEMTAPRKAAWHHGMTPSKAPLAELLADADVLLEDRRSEDWPDLKGVTLPETLVHVVATGYPEETPQRPATDLTLMAQSGLMHVIGTAEAPPLRLPGEQAYALTGIQVATAALMGLRARRLTGKGQRTPLSALQSATLSNYREAVMYEWTGRIGRRVGNRLVRGSSGVRQVWPCSDGFVTWSMIDNPGMMRALVRVMVEQGAAGELAEVDWGAILVADTDQEVIDRWQGIVAKFFARHDRATLAGWSLEHGWGLSAITKLSEVPESPQMKARGIFPDGGTLPTGPLFAVHPAKGGAA